MSAALDVFYRPEALTEIYQLLEQESKLKAFFSVTAGLMRSSDASSFESSVICLSVSLCE